MTDAAELIDELEARGLTLAPLDGGRVNVSPRERLTPEVRELIIGSKPAILRELRRRQALKILADHPESRRAWVVDPDTDPSNVFVMLALRGVGSCDIEIPRAKWCPFTFMKFLEAREQ